MEPTQIKALELKASLRQMVDESGVPPKAIADLIGVAYSTFMAYLDPSVDLLPPAHRLPLMLSVCRTSTALTNYFASLQGAVVVPLPKPGTPDRCLLGKVMFEFSNFLTEHAEATSNGAWEAHEVAKLKEIAVRLHACVSAQVLFAERQVAPTVLRIDEKRRA